AWENPHPRKTVVAVRFEPVCGVVVISAVSAGKTDSMPLRWQRRHKAVLTLPRGVRFDSKLDEQGQSGHVRLDMGQVISVTPRPMYPNRAWARTYNNRVPDISDREVLVEYTAHPEARFHLPGGRTVPVARAQRARKAGEVRGVPPADQRVTIRVVDRSSGKPVAVKLHLHGQAGEHLPPIDRHRIPNPDWFQDYSVDFLHQGIHLCTYIPGETRVDLPLGRVYLEVSKGFEIRPVRKVLQVTRRTRRITIRLAGVLPWRENG
ncbi:hypothetical protein LCGC14_2680050, partial [marine sediment metagenome]